MDIDPSDLPEPVQLIGKSLKTWQSHANKYLGKVRKEAPRAAEHQTLLNSTAGLGELMGVELRDPATYDRVRDWWQTEAALYPEVTLELLATQAKSTMSKAVSQLKKGKLSKAAGEGVLSMALSLIGWGEGFEAREKARQVAAKKEKKPAACVAPKPRKGGCSGNWDGMVTCIRREGGITLSDSSVLAELEHAAGGRKQIPPGLVTRSGKSWTAIAAKLTEEGYIDRDRHGRPDEAKALEAVTSALKEKRNPKASPKANACQAWDLARKTERQYQMQFREE